MFQTNGGSTYKGAWAVTHPYLYVQIDKLWEVYLETGVLRTRSQFWIMGIDLIILNMSEGRDYKTVAVLPRSYECHLRKMEMLYPGSVG